MCFSLPASLLTQFLLTCRQDHLRDEVQKHDIHTASDLLPGADRASLPTRAPAPSLARPPSPAPAYEAVVGGTSPRPLASSHGALEQQYQQQHAHGQPPYQQQRQQQRARVSGTPPTSRHASSTSLNGHVIPERCVGQSPARHKAFDYLDEPEEQDRPARAGATGAYGGVVSTCLAGIAKLGPSQRQSLYCRGACA